MRVKVEDQILLVMVENGGVVIILMELIISCPLILINFFNVVRGSFELILPLTNSYF
jgi:hypothetical protein